MEYSAIFRRLPLAIVVVDRNLRVRDASEAYAEIAGVAVDVCVGGQFDAGLAHDMTAGVADAVHSGLEFDAAEPGGADDPGIRVAVRPLGDEDGCSIVVVTRPADAARDQSVLALQDAIRTIRHDINNPLTGALGNINLLLRRSDLDEKTRTRLKTAEQEIKKVSAIVARLAGLAPQGKTGSANS